MSLLDEFLPEFHFRERHARAIPAAAERALAQVREIDLARSPVIGPLFALRGAGRLRAGRLGDFFETGFVVLAERPGEGLVVGSVGEFWKPAGGIRRIAAEQFVPWREAGTARLAWSWEFRPRGAHACEAVTETRIHCVDAAARWRMQFYWWAIRPASGLIRREMLRLLAQRCSDRG